MSFEFVFSNYHISQIASFSNENMFQFKKKILFDENDENVEFLRTVIFNENYFALHFVDLFLIYD